MAYSVCENIKCVTVTVMKGVRFADSQESGFQTLKRSNIGNAVLVGGRSADIQEFCFQAENVQIWNMPN